MANTTRCSRGIFGRSAEWNKKPSAGRGETMGAPHRARKDLSNECGVQWVLTKPQGSGRSQARHHRKKQHPSAMALPTANLNGQGRKKHPKSKVKLTGKGKQNQMCTKKKLHIAEPNQQTHARARHPFPLGKKVELESPTNAKYNKLRSRVVYINLRDRYVRE